jgi:hypothetical protein
MNMKNNDNIKWLVNRFMHFGYIIYIAGTDLLVTGIQSISAALRMNSDAIYVLQNQNLISCSLVG